MTALVNKKWLLTRISFVHHSFYCFCKTVVHSALFKFWVMRCLRFIHLPHLINYTFIVYTYIICASAYQTIE